MPHTRRAASSAQFSEEAHIASILGDDAGKSFDERGITMGVIVKLFAIMESTMQHVANATVADSHKPGSTVRRELHGHPLDQTGGKDLIVITKSDVLPGKADVPYPYTFLGAEEPPATLGGMFSAGFYVWDTRHMVPVVGQSVLHSGTVCPHGTLAAQSALQRRRTELYTPACPPADTWQV